MITRMADDLFLHPVCEFMHEEVELEATESESRKTKAIEGHARHERKDAKAVDDDYNDENHEDDPEESDSIPAPRGFWLGRMYKPHYCSAY